MVVPTVTQEDLTAFHARIFDSSSPAPAMTFEAQPITEEHEADDDSLGYYDDGVKRTLTDEQVAMFRHSEIQALLRDRRHKTENKDTSAEVEEDTGRSASTSPEQVDGLAEEDEEEEYARFLEEERCQMQRDAAKRRRSTDDASVVRGNEATHRRTARELDDNFETNDSLDYGEEPSRSPNSGGHERNEDFYKRRRVDYTDHDRGGMDTMKAEALSHVNGVSDGGKKTWWPMIGS